METYVGGGAEAERRIVAKHAYKIAVIQDLVRAKHRGATERAFHNKGSPVCGVRLQINSGIPAHLRNEAIHGILETSVDHHAAPYSLTEEFASMYRLHAMIPNYFDFTAVDGLRGALRENCYKISGRRARATFESIPLAGLVYSFGTCHPGALRLHNYPQFLQHFYRGNGEMLDLGTIAILRDRERGVPRFNVFRESVGLPRAATFEELTDDPVWASKLNELYEGDVDLVDLMVGMFAEPLLPGFAISETAFRIFILLAPRRLKSDRFLADDYNAETYAALGLEGIDRNSFRSVLLRHCPELELALRTVTNAFVPW